MLLCLDVGNSHIFGGVFHADKLVLRFRFPSDRQCTSDQLGTFLKSVLRENNLDPQRIDAISACSVVPSLDYSIRAACIKYFGKEPFMLQAGVKTGLKLKVQNPLEVGADRIANALAALELYPNQNIVLIDFGTATTFCALSRDKTFLGGAIMPGMRTAMLALSNNAAKLEPVEIIKIDHAVGKNTVTNIQSGLYFGQLGAMQELITRFQAEVFNNEKPVIIGSGGFSHLFEDEKIFAAIIPDLVLQGLQIAWQKNQ